MMKEKIQRCVGALSVVVLAVFCSVLVLGATAIQEPSAVVGQGLSDVKPTLSDLETAYVQIVGLAGQLAQCQTENLATVRQAVELRKDVLRRLEQAHPGYTMNWQTGVLVRKQ